MQAISKKSQTSKTKSTTNDNSHKMSPKQGSTYLPSFSGISSAESFEQTSNRIKINKQQSLTTSQSMSNLQDFILVNDGVEYIFDFTQAQIDTDDIFDIFEQITNQLEFQMIERESNYCTAIKQVKNSSLLSKLNITELFTGCFAFLKANDQLTHIKGNSLTSKAPSAVKIIVSKVLHDSQEMRIGRIKGLSGLVRQIRVFVQKFKQKITQYLPEQSHALSHYFFYDPQKQTQQQNKKSIQHSDPYHLEISTFYVIEKILSNNVYEIGGITQSLTNDYMNSFQNVQESIGLIPQPINNAVKIVNEIYYWFTMQNQASQNNGNNKTKVGNLTQQSLAQDNESKEKVIKKIPLHESMSPFIRISIEKYIFQRLTYPIFDIYKMKNIQNEQIFTTKRSKIFQKMSTRQILEQISLNQKFWSVDKQRYNDLQYIHTRKQTVIIDFNLQKALVRMSVPACAQLEKIPLTANPREKIKHMQLAYTSLKTFYYDFSKQKYCNLFIIEQNSLLFLLLNVEGLRKELDIIGDFIECDPYEMESQKRLYINLSESYNYVLRDWKV